MDHINGNKLDNRRSNLRVCTNSQNIKNRKLNSDNTSGYKGVYRQEKWWRAEITSDKKRMRLGLFTDPIEAAKAYDKAALEYHGEFARLNFEVI